MKKLKIAILWHFHQPYYKKDSEFILPWVRLHGVKDYKDLPELFGEFPNIRQTINIVPSMWVQINDYINNTTQDSIQILSRKQYNDFSESDKREFIRMFFLCNEEQMIRPYPAYSALFDKSKNTDFNGFSEQEIIDIQVWYNLTWIGYFSRKNPMIERLFIKSSGFTVQERDMLLHYHIEVLSLIKSRLQMLEAMGNLEISVSPFNHPILPLLCDTDSVKESMPNAELPAVRFAYPEDANEQVSSALEYYRNIFNSETVGMWPSEGSLSNEALNILIKNGILWAASDEMVLSNSFKENYKPYYKFFPITYQGDSGKMTLFFRDHSLSDAIGFEYSRWNAEDAANDFINRLLNIKNYLISELSEDSLETAVVPIILDGENCWEFYRENGVPFLRALFSKLQDSQEIETVLFKDVINTGDFGNSTQNDYAPTLTNLQAGSWINGNFNIWAGHQDHRIAWSVLSQARELVEKKKETFTKEKLAEIMNLIYIAEGSDWFWWYGDTHWAENKFDFDELFRYNLRQIYSLLGEAIPEVLLTPINQQLENKALIQPTRQLNLQYGDDMIHSDEWQFAGKYSATAEMSSMHKSGDLVKNIYFGNNQNKLFIKLELLEELTASSNLILNIVSGSETIKIEINSKSFKINADNLNSILYFCSGIFVLMGLEHSFCNSLALSLSSNHNNTETSLSSITINLSDQ